MKILHVYRTCYPETKGGTEQVMRYLTRGMQKYGAQSKILSISDTDDKQFNHDGTEIILCKKTLEISSNSFSPKLFSKFRELSQWADIIHYHYPWPTGDLLSLTCHNKPTLATYHSDIIKQKWLKKLYRPLESTFLNSLDMIVATSPQYQQSSPNLLKHHNKTHVVPLAIDPAEYQNLETDWQANDRLSALGQGYFLFVGVLRYYKGLHYLLDAAKATGLPTVIAGGGPLEAELRERIEQENIHNVTLAGFVSEEEKYKLLANSKAFVFSSHLRSEAFGVSLLEAQMLGKPIISCEIGTGTSYVNINQETGLVVKAACAKSLGDAMVTLYNDHNLVEKYGQGGYQRAMTHFTINHQAEEYNRLYNILLERK